MIRKMYDNVLDTAFPHALPPSGQILLPGLENI